MSTKIIVIKVAKHAEVVAIKWKTKDKCHSSSLLFLLEMTVRARVMLILKSS